MGIANNTRRCWKAGQWPEIDRNAWELGCTPGDPFDDPHYGAILRSDSLAKIAKGYGRWLCFLDSRSWLDPLQSPLHRVTRPRLRAYFHDLLAAGNADYTVIGRFAELTTAMKILAPGQDVAWIRRPYGTSIYAILRKSKRSLMVPDAGALYAWGLELMDTADAAPTPVRRLVAWRDGLLVAVFAARGRRLRSMALLRVGHELVFRDGRYRIELTPTQVKTGRYDRFDLPEDLTPYVCQYLEVVWPALLNGRCHDVLWVNSSGEPWTAKGIQDRMTKLTRRRFGQAFGPHRFRHAIGTTAPMRDPAHPGLAAGVLGISAATVELHYDRAGQSQAAATLDHAINQRRRRLSRDPRPPGYTIDKRAGPRGQCQASRRPRASP